MQVSFEVTRRVDVMQQYLPGAERVWRQQLHCKRAIAWNNFAAKAHDVVLAIRTEPLHCFLQVDCQTSICHHFQPWTRPRYCHSHIKIMQSADQLWVGFVPMPSSMTLSIPGLSCATRWDGAGSSAGRCEGRGGSSSSLSSSWSPSWPLTSSSASPSWPLTSSSASPSWPLTSSSASPSCLLTSSSASPWWLLTSSSASPSWLLTSSSSPSTSRSTVGISSKDRVLRRRKLYRPFHGPSTAPQKSSTAPCMDPLPPPKRALPPLHGPSTAPPKSSTAPCMNPLPPPKKALPPPAWTLYRPPRKRLMLPPAIGTK